MNRKHFVSSDGGKTWVPKVGFDSPETAQNSGFSFNKWQPYECDFCGKIHVATFNREKKYE